MGKRVKKTKQISVGDRRALDKLSTRRNDPRSFIDPDLARRGAAISAELGVQVGLLIERDGRIAEVIRGSASRIYLPDLGRFRVGGSRLRRLRLVVFDPSSGSDEISFDLITDLEKLRLDAVIVVKVERGGPSAVTVAHLLPQFERDRLNQSAASGRSFSPGLPSASRKGVEILRADSPRDLDYDFEEFIGGLESELASFAPQTKATSKDAALLIGVYTGPLQEAEFSMRELEELARTAGLEVRDKIVQRRRELDPRTLVGRGKLEDIVLQSLDHGAEILVFDRELSPGQLRNITNSTELKVIDRSMLILDIFAQRAKTSEGRLQVELAQLKYSLPRLTEKDTGLSRLAGGIGGRGPGETKLEISRRRARDRLSELEQRINNISKQRGLRRERRQERGVPVIAIVGYTNAGKSTLLNALTKGDVFVENKLFATLDPSSKRMRFPSEREVVFVDTVGFIRDLPEELMVAFRATLEEVKEADVLLHVVDASDPEHLRHVEVVRNTLEELDVGDKPTIVALNKCDLISDVELSTMCSGLDALAISAARRIGFKQLLARIESSFC